MLQMFIFLQVVELELHELLSFSAC